MISNYKRNQVIDLSIQNALHHTRNRFVTLKILCQARNIRLSEISLRSLIRKYEETGSINTRNSLNRILAHTKITENELEAIDNSIYENRQLFANTIKINLNLRASQRVVQRYINLLGWKKKATKYLNKKNNLIFMLLFHLILDFVIVSA